MCDDDPTLAAPVGAGVGAAAAGANGSPSYLGAGSAVALSEREMAELAVAARQVKELNGRAPDADRIVVEVAPYQPTGRVRGALTGLREGRRKVDLRIHEDAFVVADGADDPGVAIPLAQVVAVTVHLKPWGGTVHIGAGGRGSHTLRFSKRKHAWNDVAGQLQVVDPRRFAIIPVSNGLQTAYRTGIVACVLAVLALVAIPVKAIVFPAPSPGDDLPAAARTAMRDACPTWRAAPLSGAGLASAAAQVRSDFEAAAGASDEFASLPQDITTVEQFAPKAGRSDAPLVEAAAFSGAVDRIDDACTRAGA